MAIALGLLASLLIGCGDVLAGHAARRTNALSTTTVALAAGVLTTSALAPVVGGSPRPLDLWLGALSGVLIGAALALLYQAMAVSSAALASPIVALGTALIPLGWAVAGGSRPGVLAWLGVALALTGVVAVTIAPDLRGRVAAGLGYAVASAAGFGAALTLVGETAPGAGVWAAVGQRVAAVAAIGALASARSLPLRLPGRLLALTGVAGALGSGGVVAFIAGAQRGDLATVAVAASLYPVVTATLAARFGDEVLRWWQLVGIVVVLGGIALLTAG